MEQEDKRMNSQPQAPTVMQSVQTQLTEKFMDLFDLVVEERSAHYDAHPDTVPTRDEVPSIIASCGNQNALISGSLSLIPGPWGMLAAVPEIVMVIRNQLGMIYDIGMAYGHSKVLCKELLIGIFASSCGIGGLGLLTMQGGKVLIKRASLRILQRVIALLAGRVTQRLLKSVISKWLPGVGAVAIAVWSKYTTGQLGRKAVQIFKNPIETELDDEPDAAHPVIDVPVEENETLAYSKMVALINLMKLDGKVAPEESGYIETLLSNSGLDTTTVEQLCAQLASSSRSAVDYTPFSRNPDEALGLMMDLIALAKRDGEFHFAEKIYIKHVGKVLGYSEDEIVELTS